LKDFVDEFVPDKWENEEGQIVRTKKRFIDTKRLLACSTAAEAKELLSMILFL
jgi:hypothetical protein